MKRDSIKSQDAGDAVGERCSGDDHSIVIADGKRMPGEIDDHRQVVHPAETKSGRTFHEGIRHERYFPDLCI